MQLLCLKSVNIKWVIILLLIWGHTSRNLYEGLGGINFCNTFHSFGFPAWMNTTSHWLKIERISESKKYVCVMYSDEEIATLYVRKHCLWKLSSLSITTFLSCIVWRYLMVKCLRISITKFICKELWLKDEMQITQTQKSKEWRNSIFTNRMNECHQ